MCWVRPGAKGMIQSRLGLLRPRIRLNVRFVRFLLETYALFFCSQGIDERYLCETRLRRVNLAPE